MVTLLVAALVLATFALQSAFPDLLPLLSRDPRMLHSGEVWRAVSALFAQDGGTSGLLFNLFWLLVLGTTAERRFSRVGWLAAYFLGGIVTEFIALAWQPHGAGNSIACLALAGALCSDWREGRWRWWRAGVGLAGVVAASLLLLDSDIHGIGFFAGLVIGFVLVATSAPALAREIGANDNSNVVVFGEGTDTVH
jgi:rhomboid protease GluP